MTREFFENQLYPLQDEVLGLIGQVDTGFYLSGGTAASRGYLQHRFSDDLDFFVNDDPNFGLWADRFILRLTSTNFRSNIVSREARFVRLEISRSGVTLKIEMIDDVPSRVGSPVMHPLLGRLDTAENILANKITAVLDRSEPKDLADIWGFCCMRGLSIRDAIEGAQGKAVGVFPADLARALARARVEDWHAVRWIDPPAPEKFVRELGELAESLLAR